MRPQQYKEKTFSYSTPSVRYSKIVSTLVSSTHHSIHHHGPLAHS